jgi:hypothetical protein
MSDKNTAELARLIKAHLADKSIGPVAFTKLLPTKNQRTFYNWLDGAVPRNDARGPLEDALGWKRGSVTEVLESPITRTFTLSELRDWEQISDESGGKGLAVKASDLSIDELLIELTRRVGALQTEVTVLREGSGPTKPMFDLAANRHGEGRNTEHLEGDA